MSLSGFSPFIIYCQIVLVWLLPIGASQAAVKGGAINVAVASNFLPAAREIAERYEKLSGHKIVLSSGSTGKLYAQIKHGAPYHLFLAADVQRPELLEKEGLALANSRFTYAIGQLALWSTRQAITADNALAVIRKGDIARLAIANPRTAPYGVAARELLEKVGSYSKLKGHLVRGENITQTYQFVATGNADLGLVAYSQVMADDHGKGFWLVPQEYYTPLRQQGVILKQQGGLELARDFVKFLRSEEVRDLLHTRFGYGT